MGAVKELVPAENLSDWQKGMMVLIKAILSEFDQFFPTNNDAMNHVGDNKLLTIFCIWRDDGNPYFIYMTGGPTEEKV